MISIRTQVAANWSFATKIYDTSVCADQVTQVQPLASREHQAILAPSCGAASS
jgi:hypothetical protein